MEIVTVLAGGAVSEYKFEQDAQLVAVIFNVDEQLGGASGDGYYNQNFLLGFDRVSSDYSTHTSNASPGVKNLIAIRSGVLPFPVQVEKGRSVFFSAAFQGNLQLWLA